MFTYVGILNASPFHNLDKAVDILHSTNAIKPWYAYQSLKKKAVKYQHEMKILPHHFHDVGLMCVCV